MMFTISVIIECFNEVYFDMIWEKISILRLNNFKYFDFKNIEDIVRIGVIII